MLHGGSDRSVFFDDLWLLDLDRVQWTQVTLTSGIEGKGKEEYAEKATETENEKGKEKEKVNDTEKDKNEGRSAMRREDQTIFWPTGSRDHAAVIYDSQFYILGGKARLAYAQEYLVSYHCS